MVEEPEKEHWVLDKHINIGIIGALLLQTAGVVWWASSISLRVDDLETSRVNTGMTLQRLDTSREDLGTRLTRVEDATTSILEIVRRMENRTARQDGIGKPDPGP